MRGAFELLRNSVPVAKLDSSVKSAPLKKTKGVVDLGGAESDYRAADGCTPMTMR